MKVLFPLKKRNPSRAHAFTLVEVVLALGVASFGLISMLGLLTVGLKTFHDAINATTEAQITQQLANQLELASYSAMAASTQSNYYFTQEGIATNASHAVYTASIQQPAKLSVPVASGTTLDTSVTNTMTFVISVWSKTSTQTNATPIHIANNGS